MFLSSILPRRVVLFVDPRLCFGVLPFQSEFDTNLVHREQPCHEHQSILVTTLMLEGEALVVDTKLL